MTKLMKYEWRKSMFTKLILLVVTGIAEIVYLYGMFAKNENWFAGGVIALMCCGMFGIIYIGIETLLTFSKDLNTKQSYMLFLTPHSSYEILGAKVLVSAISIFVTGLFFVLLAALDIFIGVTYLDGLKEFTNLIQQIMRIEIEWNDVGQSIVMVFGSSLVSWLMTIVTGYLAIVLSATVLAGKKLSGAASFVIFLLVSWGCGMLLDFVVPGLQNATLEFWMTVACGAVITVILYAVTGWIMEKKLSV